jgi:hypothetical protein
MRKNAIKVGLILSFWALYVVGCHITYEPIKLDKPNTFMYGTTWYDTTILGVIVCRVPKAITGVNSNQEQPVWLVKATKEVPARGFVVTVGEIPEGFQQIVPTPPAKPVLLPGEHYEIDIVVEQWDMSLTRPTVWIAQ